MKIKHSVFLVKKAVDPNERDNPVLIKESLKRFPTYAFEPKDLFLDNGVPKAKVKKVIIDKDGRIAEGGTKLLDLNDGCLVSIKLDPPFNTAYITALHMLAKVGKNSHVINNPIGIINMPEKIISDELKEFLPPTLITSDEEEIMKFWKKHSDIVLKPLYEYGGKGVFRLKKGEENYKSILTALMDKYKEPIIAQKYIPEVKKGDKRIVLIEGEVFGQLLRVPAKGQLQASVSQGGSMHDVGLTAREKQICKKLKPILKKNDIFLCGIDVIGNYLTEVNVTAPAIAFLLNNANKGKKNYIPAEKRYWDMLEKRVRAL
jgi:glutathione synthase